MGHSLTGVGPAYTRNPKTMADIDINNPTQARFVGMTVVASPEDTIPHDYKIESSGTNIDN